MTDKNATRTNIITALNSQFSCAKKDDLVLFFFSGHGRKDGFCPYDMDRKGKNVLSYNDIYATFRNCQASRKVVFADACMSGAIRKEQTRSSRVSSKSDVVMFLSSRPNEYSIETPKMKNGFFTAYLERGLRGGADSNKDKIITAKELFIFVSNGVKKISHSKQHPVMWGRFDDDFIMMDWR